METDQPQQLFRVLLSLIYQVDIPIDEWLRRISTAFAKLLPLDHGMGVVGYSAQLSVGEPILDRVWGVSTGLDRAFLAKSFQTYKTNMATHVQYMMHAGVLCRYASDFPVAFFQGQERVLSQLVPGHVTKDIFGINGVGVDGNSVSFAALLPESSQRQISTQMQTFIAELVHHIAVASHLIHRPKDMTIPEAFIDFQQKTKEQLALRAVSMSTSPQVALEELSFAVDQAEEGYGRYPQKAAVEYFYQLQIGSLILHHSFEKMGFMYFVVQKTLPILVPKEAFSREESVLFHHFALTESVKQAVDFLPGGGRSIQRGYQLMKQIAWKLGMPQAKPEELLPLAKVWLAAIAEAPSLVIEKKRINLEIPSGLQVTSFSLGCDIYQVIRVHSTSKVNLFFQRVEKKLPRSSFVLVQGYLAGKTSAELATMHQLTVSTVERRLATARRLGLLLS